MKLFYTQSASSRLTSDAQRRRTNMKIAQAIIAKKTNVYIFRTKNRAFQKLAKFSVQPMAPEYLHQYCKKELLREIWPRVRFVRDCLQDYYYTFKIRSQVLRPFDDSSLRCAASKLPKSELNTQCLSYRLMFFKGTNEVLTKTVIFPQVKIKFRQSAKSFISAFNSYP